MNTRQVAIAAALVLLMTAQPSVAQRKATFIGAGVLPCGEFVSSKDQPGASGFYVQWAQGYMTAYNYYAKGAQIVTPEAATILLYAERHCRSNPLDSYAQAIGTLINELGGIGFLARPGQEVRK